MVKAKENGGAWTNLCKPVDEGGIGMQEIGDIKKAMHMKFPWHLIFEENL